MIAAEALRLFADRMADLAERYQRDPGMDWHTELGTQAAVLLVEGPEEYVAYHHASDRSVQQAVLDRLLLRSWEGHL